MKKEFLKNKAFMLIIDLLFLCFGIYLLIREGDWIILGIAIGLNMVNIYAYFKSDDEAFKARNWFLELDEDGKKKIHKDNQTAV